MFRNILKPNIVRRFNHINCKTTFQENNKVIENLMREQNKILNKIQENSEFQILFTLIFGFGFLLKPTR